MRNHREDGMYHAYNVLDLGEDEVQVDRPYLMLEGQVAALSSGIFQRSGRIRRLSSGLRRDLLLRFDGASGDG
jgi:hypothetical protein